MTPLLQHAMRPEPAIEHDARGRFVSGLRRFILNDLAADMRSTYEKVAAPEFARTQGRPPETSDEAHAALRGRPGFNIYSAMRVQAQRMVWSAVTPTVARDADRIAAANADVQDRPGSATLNPHLEIPRNVSAIDVHLLPGSYVGSADSLETGAIYDRGLAVFSMGLMGENLDDIGLSMAQYIRLKYPDFQPKRILDLGCTVGHNTLPWKQAYPQAEVHAIDVAASGLLYGSARAKMQGQEVHFHQMSADALEFESGSFDLVFSSMFLHEISRKTCKQVFEEALRVLRPGGMMLHMELPPNDQLSAFDGFYLDWDSYYNEEPFYKGFRDQDPRNLCRTAGFGEENYFQFVVPSIGIYGKDAIAAAIADETAEAVDRETTGRLADGVRWFGFGAWKA